MKLIKMVDFVLEYYSSEEHDELQILDLMNNYAFFLKQPLTVGMFVPADEQGNVLEEPEMYNDWVNHKVDASKYTKECFDCASYKEAKERVMFEGWSFYVEDERLRLTDEKSTLEFYPRGYNRETIELYDGVFVYSCIEDALSLSLTLTPTAIKKLGL